MIPSATEDKRRLILDSARRLLVERGFQDIILDDVARAAGVAKGTLFLYYKSKDEMFSAAFADLVDQLGTALEGVRACGKSGRPLLEETVRVILEYLERNHDFMSQFSVGRFPGCGKRSCEKLMERFARNNERLVRILDLCAGQGLVRPRDMSYAASALFGLCRSAMINRLLKEDREPLVARAPQVVEMFLYGARGQ